MTAGWVKSLQCKSRSLDDVVEHHASSSKHYHYHHLIPDSASCRKSVQSLKDVVETTKSRKPKKPKPREPPLRRPVSRKPEPGFVEAVDFDRMQFTASTRPSRAVEELFPTLAELPGDHPSRNVVEIIFRSSWSERSFPGRVEMVFKVQNLSRTLTRFEEYRGVVKSRAGSGSGGAADGGAEDLSRCFADGNEMMRFYCLGPIIGGAYEAWAFQVGKGAAICTFGGSGGAHESAGGGRGRRAMLVCRVIAGRVSKQLGYDSLVEKQVGYDSVSGENGELQVFDSRAVLPCFLIIYKL